jgi:hypothetical protein
VLVGSYASGAAREDSDLDLIVLFDVFTDELKVNAEQLIARLARELPMQADIAVCGVHRCPPLWAVSVRAGRTIYGDESIEPTLPAIEAYTAALIGDVLGLMQGLRAGKQLAAPLQLPDAALPLFGYEAKPLRDAGGQWRPSTKALSMIANWGATALIALHGRRFVPGKNDVIPMYRDLIGDEWAGLIEEIDRVCRRELSYSVPLDRADLARVRDIALRLLAFENHLVAVFREPKRADG